MNQKFLVINDSNIQAITGLTVQKTGTRWVVFGATASGVGHQVAMFFEQEDAQLCMRWIAEALFLDAAVTYFDPTEVVNTVLAMRAEADHEAAMKDTGDHVAIQCTAHARMAGLAARENMYDSSFRKLGTPEKN